MVEFKEKSCGHKNPLPASPKFKNYLEISQYLALTDIFWPNENEKHISLIDFYRVVLLCMKTIE